MDLIISTGGTGFSPRDVTPEAVKPLFRREMDGFAILFHQASHGTVGFSTLQSRAFAGQIDDTFVFCLPGSTGACRDGWDLVLKYELDSRYRPCSLAGQIPRLRTSLRMTRLTHLDETGRARMVDVSAKAATARTATASANAHLQAGHARAGPRRDRAERLGHPDRGARRASWAPSAPPS